MASYNSTLEVKLQNFSQNNPFMRYIYKILCNRLLKDEYKKKPISYQIRNIVKSWIKSWATRDKLW